MIDPRHRSPRRLSRRWRSLFILLATAAIVGLLVRQTGGFQDLFQVIRSADRGDVAAAALLGVLGPLLAVERWRVALRAVGCRVTYRHGLYAVLATWPGSVVTPSRLSDLLRAAVIRDRVPLALGLGSVLAEKAFDLHSLCVMALLGGAIGGQPGLAGTAGALVAGFWAAIALGPRLLRRGAARWLPSRWGRRVAETVQAIEGLRRSPGLLGAMLGLSFAGWFLSALIIARLLASTGSLLSHATILCAWPVAVLAGVLPITASGLGTRDGVFLFMASQGAARVDAQAVVAATLIYPVVTTWLYAVVGLPFLHHLLRSGRLQAPLSNAHD